MKLGSRRTIVGALGTAVVGLLCVALASGQTAPEEKPLLAEQVFKNVQVLRGITVDEFMGTMGFIASSLSLNCIDCHVTASASSLEKYAEDTPIKQTARRMILMVRTINQANFGGKRMVTCYSCHRGSDRPKITPSLAEQYGTPPPDDPDEVEIVEGASAPGTPSADQVLDKYIQALGGAQRLASLTSFVAKGNYQGYDTEAADGPVPAEVYAKAPGQRITIVHGPQGDNITTYDGRAGWIVASGSPLTFLTLTGGELEGAKFDADLFFPVRIKQALSEWRAGFPETIIDDRKVNVIQGNAGKSLVKLYFDKDSGLLVRQVRYADAILGLNPMQVDYSDYRPVAGVKMPFHWVVTWTDGRSTTNLNEVQANVPIDAAKFVKPAAAPPRPATR